MNRLRLALSALILAMANVPAKPAAAQNPCELFGPGSTVESKDQRVVLAPDGSMTMQCALPADRFEGKSLDSTKWKVDFHDGATVKQDGRLIVYVSGKQRDSGATLTTPYRFPGDFDVQVAFSVIEGWTQPARGHVDGAALGFKAGDHDQRITLNLDATGTQRVMAYSFKNGPLATAEHPAEQGAYRIVRRGPKVEFYYAARGAWQRLCVAETPTSDAEVYISAGSADTVLGFSTVFGSFQVNNGPTTYPDAAGLTTRACDLSGGAVLRSLRVNADIPRESYVVVKLYGKERPFARWKLLGEYHFDQEHKELPVGPPAYAESVKLGVATGDGIRLVTAGATSPPVLRSVQLLTRAPDPVPNLTIVEPKPNAVEKWDVYELKLNCPGQFDNPFWDVLVTGVFEGPKSQAFVVEGFYYGDQTWKIRFAPTTEGDWKYAVRFTSPTGTTIRTGGFECKPAGPGNHGFISISRRNPQAFEYSDGTPFIPAGINGHTPAVGAAFLGFAAGKSQVPDMWSYLSEKRVTAYRLQMFHQTMMQHAMEWNPAEGSANLLLGSGGLDRYSTSNAKLIDRWLDQTKPLGISWELCLMAIHTVSKYPFEACLWSKALGGPYRTLDEMYSSCEPKGLELQRRYVRYAANRWSAYRNVFVWEYNNEFGARTSTAWAHAMDATLDEADPYQRPHTVSFWSYEWSKNSPLNASSSVDLTHDSLYPRQGFTEFNIDRLAHDEAASRYAAYGKPVLVGEYGVGEEQWTGATSAKWRVFERLGYWGAFTGGGFVLFWMSGSHTPDGHRYNRGTLDFLSHFRDIVSNVRDYLAMRPNDSLVSVANADLLRAYCLASDTEALVYVHHYADHTTRLRDQTIRVTMPPARDYEAKWFNPASGETVAHNSGSSKEGPTSLTVPEFTIDLVLYLSYPSRGSGASTNASGKGPGPK